MSDYDELMGLFSELDEYASFIKIDAENFEDLESTKREYKDIKAFVNSCTIMNKKLTELIEGEDSAYDITQLAKGESIDG